MIGILCVWFPMCPCRNPHYRDMKLACNLLSFWDRNRIFL